MYPTSTCPVFAPHATISAGAIPILKFPVAVALLESVTIAVNGKVPAESGPPVIAPVELFSASPAGKAPLAIEYA